MGNTKSQLVQRAFFYIPLRSIHGYDVKMTDITFNRGRKKA